MEMSPRASHLLGEVERSHAALGEHSGAAEPIRRALRAIYDALHAGLSDLSDADVEAKPDADEWSIAEVLEHIAEHDRKYLELARHGVGHYVEHGLEHALQLWRLRNHPATSE